MRQYLKNIILFISPIAILAYPFDLVISSALKKEDHIEFANGEINTWNHIYSDTTYSELLIYGSSRAWVHIDPKIMSEKLGLTTFNYGIDGHNFSLQNLRHQESIRHKGYPKYIIYSIDVFTLAKRPDLFNKEQFLPYMLMNFHLNKTLLTYEGFRGKDFILPLSRYFGKKNVFDHLLTRNSSKKREQGYYGFELNWNNDFRKAKKEKGNLEIELDSSSVTQFVSLIDKLKKNGVKICLVYTPEYFAAQDFISNRVQIIDLFKSISKQRQLLFLDYSDHVISMNQKYFYNASHLNRTGAELFSKILAEELLTKKWRN